MSIVNDSLGNGFLVRLADSSFDQEHYFSAAKKNIKLSLKFGDISSSIVFQTASIDGNGNFTDIQQNTSGTLFITYNSGTGGDLNGYILSSNNKGETWTVVDVNDATTNLYNFVYVDSNREYALYAGGASGSVNRYIHAKYSTDFGNQWTNLFTLTGSGFLSSCVSSGTISGSITTGSIFFGAQWSDNSSTESREFQIYSGTVTGVPKVAYTSGQKLSGTACLDMAVSSDGIIYAVGCVSADNVDPTLKNSIVVTSSQGGTIGTWGTIYTRSGTTNDPNSFSPGFHSIEIDSSGNIYIGGAGNEVGGNPTFLILKGHVTASGDFTVVYETDHDRVTGTGSLFQKTLCSDIAINPYNEREVYAVGRVEDNGITFWTVKKSDDFGSSGSFYNIYNEKEPGGIHYSLNASASFCFVDNEQNLLVGGFISSSVTSETSASLIKYYPQSFQDNIILSSSLSGTYNTIYKEPSANALFDLNNVRINFVDFANSFGTPVNSVEKKQNSLLSFVIIPDGPLSEYISNDDIITFPNLEINFRDTFSEQWRNKVNLKEIGKFRILSKNDKKIIFETNFFVDGKQQLPNFTIEDVGSPFIEFVVHSGSYVISDFKLDFIQSLSDSGVAKYRKIDNQHNKNIFLNIRNNFFDENLMIDERNEFPHSMGIFQMKNIVLGTLNSGKVGIDEDAIIQIKHIGSVVHVMWPDQGNSNFFPIRGFGDFSSGQKPGELTTNFVAGRTVDVENYDHLTLFCYLLKESSGTLDDVEIIIERKPLKSVPFAVNQQMSSSLSSSFAIETLRDIRYKKSIDYGDLTIKEIGYPIDIDLKNVKQLRISAKQTNGQADEKNRNFIAWGRFINSAEET